MTADEPATRQNTAPANAGEGDIIEPIAFVPADQDNQGRKFSVRPWVIAFCSALVIAGLVIWYLFSAKAVVIDTKPEDANIRLSGGLQFKLANHYLLREQSYQAHITATGYYPLDSEFAVSAEQNQIQHFALTPLPGHLQITTQPSVNADVFLDGTKIGSSQETLSDIPAGEHLLELRSERYKTYAQTITIDGKDTTQNLAVTLEPAWADISLASSPSGATVYSGEIVLGQTPTTIELLEGTHTLRIHQPGYKSWVYKLDVIAGEPQSYNDIVLQKVDGLIRLNSQPSGASVTVNGKFFGTTPIELAVKPNTDHNVLLFKDGYQPLSKSLRIKSGEETALNLSMNAIVGSINVRSQPKDALLYVDGRLMGRTGQTLTLPASTHTISVRQEGYVDYEVEVTPRPGLLQQVVAKLRTEEEAKWDHIKPIIQTSLKQTLKLFRPDVSFTMGSSRREQGRRANESLREIKLDRAFYIGKYEVTNAEFRRFEKFHSSGNVKGKSLNNEQNPVTNISWEQAAKFCNWLSKQEGLPLFYIETKGHITGFNNNSTGYRLPTEAEWTWLARYDNGTMKKYAWGEQLPITGKPVNIADRQSAPLLGYIQVDYDDGYAVTAPVGSFPADQHGLYDLAGNVAEWLNDFYGVSSGLSLKEEHNPTGPESGDYHVVRGSSWAHGTVTDLRLSFRDYGIEKRYDIGFRLARYVQAQTE